MPIFRDVNIMPALQDGFGVPVVVSQHGISDTGFLALPGDGAQAFKTDAFTTVDQPVSRMMAHTDLRVDLTQFGRSRKVITAISVTSILDVAIPVLGFSAGINFNIWDPDGVQGASLDGHDWLAGSGALIGGENARFFNTGSLLPALVPGQSKLIQNYGFTPNVDISNFSSIVLSIGEAIGAENPGGTKFDLIFPGEIHLWCLPTAVLLRVTPIIDLTVRVLDDTGKPVPGATVQLLLAGSVIATTSSDQTGTAVFSNLLADFYQVTAAVSGVGQQSQSPGGVTTNTTLTFTFHTLQTEIAALEACCQTVQGQIASLSTGLSQVQGSVQTLAGQTSAQFQATNQSVTTLRGDTAAGFDQVNMRLGQLNIALANLQSSEAADRTDINSLVQAVSALQQALQSLIASLPPGLRRV